MESDSKRAMLAIILSGAVLFGWQYLYPTPQQVVSTETKTQTDKTNNLNDNVNNSKDQTSVSTKVQEVSENIQLKTIEIKNEQVSYFLNSDLSIFNSTSLNSDKISKNIFEDIAIQTLFNLNNSFEKYLFNFEKISDSQYNISSSNKLLNGSLVINNKNVLELNITSAKKFKYRLVYNTKEIDVDQFKTNQFFVYSKELDKFSVTDSDKMIDSIVNWFGVDYNHYFNGIVLNNKSLHNVSVRPLDNETRGILAITSVEASNNLVAKNFLIQKNYDDLIALGSNLEIAVDFGMWSIIAVPILRGLQFFFTVIPNWGIAIILLTIFIRMLTFPLQYKSFKSMKKMQIIQPELTKIREKHKENPQKMQQETMALFKKAGANPIGGCLPLLLQMPVFFAFYQVLYSSVELVDAPFMLWIVDLSEKDPYYVLPVLMSLAMFLNMKLTPSASADPTQQKIMMFMPLIFGFMMMGLPAGLTLYILISTIMGMLQQLFVYKRVT